MLSSRLSTEHGGSPSQPTQRSHAPSYSQRSMSDDHRCIVGFDAPAGLPHPSLQQHAFTAAGRTPTTSSVLAAVSDHLQRLDPTRADPSPSEAPSTLRPLHTAPPATASALPVPDPTDYGSVVQQACPLVMHERHALCLPRHYPCPSPLHSGVLHHVSHSRTLHGCACIPPMHGNAS